jgi:hypothetical protein
MLAAVSNDESNAESKIQSTRSRLTTPSSHHRLLGSAKSGQTRHQLDG